MRKKRMSESGWIDYLSKESGVTRNLTEQVWNTFLDILAREVNESESKTFYIPKFGVFSKTTHKGHPLNLNVGDGEKKISDYETFKFKVGSKYKERVLGIKSENLEEDD